MIKTLRFFVFSALMMICCSSFAQTVTFDATTDLGQQAGSSTGNDQVSKDGITIATSPTGSFGNGNQYRIYKNSVLTISSTVGKITKIEFTCTASGTAKYGPGNFTDATAGSYAYSDIIGTWTGEAAEVSMTASTNQVRATQIVVTYVSDGSASKADPALAFSETSVEVVLGETFTAPTLSKATTADVTYTSSNTEVATVDAATGAVTIVAAGTTKITATAAENDNYRAGNASYTINVKNPVYTEVTLPYNESFVTDQGSFVIQDVTLGDGLTYVWKHTTYNTDGYMKASAYKSAPVAAESWIISPTINMTGISEATVAFDHTGKFFGTPTAEATIWIKEETAAEWTQLTIPTYFANTDYVFVNNEIDITEWAGKKVKIGFKYTSSAEYAGTWEIKNFSVVGVVSGIENVENNDIIEKNSPIYNIAGQVVTKDYKGIVIKNGKKYIQK